ncbi:MAG TPA: SH3 domain-containing C40 family peptidase [Gemmatimonadaceae bacterium]|nr:SH3 domain-containing C40 family peptidase [Gemmatimonadaceae bacterium]
MTPDRGVSPMATQTHTVEPEAPLLYVATVRTPVAPMHGEPRIASQMISQQVAGHHVDVLDEEGDDWVRARGEDGYDGWMHTGFLARAPQATARQSRQPTRVSLGCVTHTASGDRRALPLRAFLAPDESLKSGEVIEAIRLPDRFPLDPIAITRSAQEYFAGTSYVWGGVTPWGADCSGLVQSVFALHGLQLPRDAWQQAEMGADAGCDVGELKPADLLFFSDRPDKRVTHVGIALGERRMVHLALGRGGYSIERLNDRADVYVDRLRDRFLFARRVLRAS